MKEGGERIDGVCLILSREWQPDRHSEPQRLFHQLTHPFLCNLKVIYTENRIKEFQLCCTGYREPEDGS